jgi:hypothetical protein
MPPTKEELMERAQLVRCFEASCKIEHPTEQERNFRLSLMKRLGVAYGLREVRDLTITAAKGV